MRQSDIWYNTVTIWHCMRGDVAIFNVLYHLIFCFFYYIKYIFIRHYYYKLLCVIRAEINAWNTGLTDYVGLSTSVYKQKSNGVFDN